MTIDQSMINAQCPKQFRQPVAQFLGFDQSSLPWSLVIGHSDEAFYHERIHLMPAMTQPSYRLPKSALRPEREASPAVALAALVGTITIIASVLFESLGMFIAFSAVAGTDFSDGEDMEATMKAVSQLSAVMGKASGWLTLGNVLLLAGGALVTYALHFGGFRARWFFWTTLGLALLNLWQPWSAGLDFMVPLPYAGTFFGVWWLWCLLWARRDFFPRKVIVIPE